MPFNSDDPKIVKIKFWVNGKLASTWTEKEFSPSENDAVLRLTPKIVVTRDENDE